jgi:hypothetical protein
MVMGFWERMKPVFWAKSVGLLHCHAQASKRGFDKCDNAACKLKQTGQGPAQKSMRPWFWP